MEKPIKLVVKLSWKIISNIPILKAFKQPLENMFSAYGEKKDDDDAEDGEEESKPPLQEEIMIPSVTQLLEAGVQFAPTKVGVSSFRFHVNTLTLHILVIKVDINSDVLLRNLVAYKACLAAGPMVLTRYTELMNEIIDTEVDAGVLCRGGIIANHLKSEKEVADLWNRIRRKQHRLGFIASKTRVSRD